jgi:hypothetical protein
LIGILGLLAQMLLGGAHIGHLGHHAHVGQAHGGHAGHSHAGQHGHGQHHDQAHQGEQSRGLSPLWTLLSPLTFFSICLGMGATGLLLKHLHLRTGLVALAALLGGLVFYGLIIRPLWNVMFRFASTPSTALAGTVAKEAEALTRFDSTGKGLVRVTIDGQIARILATLEPEDRAEGAVRPGDRLTVTSVDGHTNSCRVARL